MQVVGSAVLDWAQVPIELLNSKGGCSMDRGMALYPLIYCLLLIILVVVLLMVASQVIAQTGHQLYDAIETLRFAV